MTTMYTHRAINLQEELTRLQENQTLLIEDEIYISDLADSVVNDKLNELVDSLQADPEALITNHNQNAAKSFLKHMKDLRVENKGKFADIILSAFDVFLNRSNDNILRKSNTEYRLPSTFRQILDSYLFLWHCLIIEIEKFDKSAKNGKSVASVHKKSKEILKGNRLTPLDYYNLTHIRLVSLKIASKLVSMNLEFIYTHQSDIDNVFRLALKTAIAITESPDLLKSVHLQNAAIDTYVDCCVKHPKLLKNSIEFKIVYDYLRDEAFVDFSAIFIKKLCDVSEIGRTTLENVLKAITETPINTDDTPIVKSLSKFLLKISVLLSKEVIKQMVYLQSLLYSESYTIRSTVIEVMGNIIYFHLNNTTHQKNSFQAVESYYLIFKERYRDVSSNVRVRVIQTICKLVERRNNNSSSSYIPLNLRNQFLELTIGRLLDKSTNVRRNAIRLLSKFVEVSPFTLQRDRGSLSHKLFSERKEKLSRLINAKSNYILSNGPTSQIFQPDKSSSDISDMDIDVDNNDDTQNTLVSNSKEVNLLYVYYSDALAFVDAIANTLNTMHQLMSSSYKGESVEAMKFFVTCYNHEMEFAKAGIKKMVHKIWDKDAGESGRMSVRDTLVKCYTGLYLQKNGSPVEPYTAASNLVNCMLDMSLAEQTSFEQLLYSINDTYINTGIINALWNIFNSNEESNPRRLSAIIVLGSLARADPSIIISNIKYLLNAFIQGSFSNNMLLPKYVCYSISQLKNAPTKDCRLLKENNLSQQLVSRIIKLILETSNTQDWFACAEQAISAIYILSKSPSQVCGDIIKVLAYKCFFTSAKSMENLTKIDATAALGTNVTTNTNLISTVNTMLNNSSEFQPKLLSETSKLELSKLFFVVGHVASKQLVYLEDMEQEWKQKRNMELTRLQEEAKSAGRNVTDDVDELMATEEEITAYMRDIKECELLGGKTSLLGLFAKIISFVCANRAMFDDPVLLNISVVSLSKLMCVSPDFCEKNINILLSILESSRDPTVRNNIIIGLGDLTMCFNSILDKYMNRLDERLDDPDPSVRKCTLTLLSFLILNGMIRIRGQISSMVKCLSDADPCVRNVARLFFTEFSSKDNSIYNNLLDIISNLLDNKSGVSEKKFQEIFRIVLDFVKKEKFTETLIEKLCCKLKNSEIMAQCRNISFCIGTLIQNSDRCIKKFIDCLPYYSNKLGDRAIYSRFLNVSSKYKKSASLELKQTIEKFESVLKDLHKKYATEFDSYPKNSEEANVNCDIGTSNSEIIGKNDYVNAVKNNEVRENNSNLLSFDNIIDGDTVNSGDINVNGISDVNERNDPEKLVAFNEPKNYGTETGDMADDMVNDMTDDIVDYDNPTATRFETSLSQESGDDMDIVYE